MEAITTLTPGKYVFLYIYISLSFPNFLSIFFLLTFFLKKNWRQELVLHLCWLIGEYTSNSITTHFLVPPEILSDYHEALEIFAYERMSITKAKNEDFSENNSNNESISSTNSDFSTRLMLILISSMAKLAARWPPLISRVLLCLSKISNHRGFEEIVVTRANECLSLLKFPRFDPSIQNNLRL